MPDIEDFIGQKIPVKAITADLLAEVVPPPRRPPKPKAEYQGKRPNPNSSRKPTVRPSTPENPQ
jgi:ATP-dependent RNA helicase RhlB